MSDEHILTENERLRLENEKLRAAIDVLNHAKRQQDESEIFEKAKKRVMTWIKGLGLYATILIALLGVTSYIQAKNALIQGFFEKTEPELRKHFNEKILPEARKKIEENAALRLEAIAIKLEQQYDQRLNDFASKNNLKKPADAPTSERPAKGYVIKKFLEPLSNGLYRISAYRLNVRAKPSVEGMVLGRQGQGTVVRVTEDIDSSWAKIEVVPE